MAYALGGMNTNYRTGPFGGGEPEGVNLQGLIVAPTVSYAFNKKVTAGAALLVGYANLTGRNCSMVLVCPTTPLTIPLWVLA